MDSENEAMPTEPLEDPVARLVLATASPEIQATLEADLLEQQGWKNGIGYQLSPSDIKRVIRRCLIYVGHTAANEGKEWVFQQACETDIRIGSGNVQIYVDGILVE